MLTLRAEQLRVLDAHRQDQFLAGLEGHLQRHFPAFVAMQPRESLRTSLRAAVDEAVSVGLETRGDVSVYVNLCAVLGWDFASEPESAWLGALLRDTSIPSASYRLKLGVQELQRRLALELQQREARQRFESATDTERR
ncbi:hypothetical protein HUW63_31335 [Myxococcus sp. AM001]|nr:hypothetical protein [Myxococcus sp. AM001]